MIHKLSGIHETVDFREDEQVCLYYNDEYENYPPHWHTSFEVLMPIVNGYKALCGGKEYNLREGDVLIIGPCMLHELFAPESGERIIFQPCLNNISTKELNLLTMIITPATLITPEGYPQIYEKVKTLMLEIKEEYFLCEPYYETAIYSRFMRILVDIGRLHGALKHPVSDASNSRQKDYLDKFLYITNYINEHFAENLSLEQVADLAGFSKYHFTRLFKQYTDTSFYKYLNQKRIDYAKTLLLDPDLPVIDVALQCGFSSLSAFLRMFKQLNKCTPTEFRNMTTKKTSGSPNVFHIFFINITLTSFRPSLLNCLTPLSTDLPVRFLPACSSVANVLPYR